MIKNLGVNIANNQSRHFHTAVIVIKAHSICNPIFYFFYCFNVKFYLRAFDVYARPIIEYNNFI